MITDEDLLEFLYHMQSKTAAAEHLFDALRDNHLLFIGCSFPDWLSRFLLRIAKSRQLSLRRTEMELLVASPANRDTDLVLFLQHFSPRTKIASCSPAESAELAARYGSRAANPAAPRGNLPGAAAIGPSDVRETAGTSMAPGAVYISYAHEDQAAARRLRDFLEEEAGIDVWLTLGGLRRVTIGITRSAAIPKRSYFVPLISTAATDRDEGYYRREWSLAVE